MPSYCAQCRTGATDSDTFCGGCGSPLEAPPDSASVYDPPARQGSRIVVLFSVLGLCFVAALASLILLSVLRDQDEPAVSAQATSAVSAPSTSAPQTAGGVGGQVAVTNSDTEAASGEEPRGSQSGWDHYRTASLPGYYESVSTLNDTTTLPFAVNVGIAYNDSGANGGSTTVRAHSAATGKTYTMACQAQDDGSVVCAGGRAARLRLWG